MTIELGALALVLGLVATLGGFVFWVARVIMRFEKLERQAGYRKKDIAIILGSLQACLDGIQQLGANHGVTEAFEALNKYILESR